MARIILLILAIAVYPIFSQEAEKKAAPAKESLKKSFSLIDKAVKIGLMHKNTAARKKSKLATKITKLSVK